MDSYQIEWKQSAKKELKKLPKSIIPKIIDAVATLADDPYPKGNKKLRGTDYTYRIRMSDYRVVYSVFSKVLVIEIIKESWSSKRYLSKTLDLIKIKYGKETEISPPGWL